MRTHQTTVKFALDLLEPALVLVKTGQKDPLLLAAGPEIVSAAITTLRGCLADFVRRGCTGRQRRRFIFVLLDVVGHLHRAQAPEANWGQASRDLSRAVKGLRRCVRLFEAEERWEREWAQWRSEPV